MTIKNIGKDKVNANFLLVKVLNKKKKKELTIMFIITIVMILDGDIKKAKESIKLKINSKNINFFQYFPVACIIIFNYNRYLWQKLIKKRKLKK
ncbi:MAG: hypothetical protein ACD_12C00366G0002 [uncultured bacterium]|nr:MAG: hypothetical protein ACD_12C00366G0002 [uncultured bacterium]